MPRHPDRYVPDGRPLGAALATCTRLGIGAHQDDLEILAWPGIAHCLESPGSAFVGVTCTDGAGSPRSGGFSDVRNDEMKRFRRSEQREAADLGRYAAMLQLDFPSATLKTPKGIQSLADELFDLLEKTRPRVLYTHNPADKHPTHLLVLDAVVSALRRLPEEQLPEEIYGCEVWRDLDWLPAPWRVALACPADHPLEVPLLAVFRSQIEGGKHYETAAPGRRRAQAVFGESHAVDQAEAVVLAIDLKPWVLSEQSRAEFLQPMLDRVRDDVLADP